MAHQIARKMGRAPLKIRSDPQNPPREAGAALALFLHPCPGNEPYRSRKDASMRDFAMLGSLLAFAAITAVADHPKRVADPLPVSSIKALSAEEISQLERGGGHGRAAELNHYPGPGHVLDLADELGLEPEQVARLSAIEARMRTETTPLGARILEQQRQLEASFAQATAEPERIRTLRQAMAETEARLRASHLTAHLDTRAVLSDAQLGRYEFLQGYSDAAAPRG